MTTHNAVQAAPLSLGLADLQRVCRDLAFSEIGSMPAFKTAIASRLQAAPISWASGTPDAAPGSLPLDSLARMQLATAAATWCNAYDAGFEDLFLAKRNVADWAAVMLRARSSGAQHVTFSSSGSTGVRKHIRHREDVLAREAQAWCQVFAGFSPAQPIRRVVVLAPTHHIYGFIWGVLLPLALGVPALDADVHALPELQPGDLLVAVPDQWAWLAQGQRRWLGGVDGVQGVSSTAPLPAAVHRQLTDSSGGQPALLRLLQIYGSSETAGLAWRADPDAPYTLAPGRSRNASGGMALALPGGQQVDLAVQDELSWASQTDFHLVRRLDHSVQVAGHNVSPDWVAAQLQSHPTVQAAAVRLSSSAQPPRLKAFVVMQAGQDHPPNRQAVQAWAAEHLPWYANPGSFSYGAELPRNALGKPSDWPDQ